MPVPAGIDDGVAAAWFLKGLTAQALVEDVEPVKPGMAVLALAAGCDEVVLYREEDFAAGVMAFTAGEGVGVAYDAVGADTFEGALASLAIKGHLVHYGQASGPIPPFDLSRLGATSAKVSRPFL